jgi:diaminopimelate epimerase
MVAGVLEKRVNRRVQVTLPGGTLQAEWLDNGEVETTGEAKYAFEGTINLPEQVVKQLVLKSVNERAKVL